MKKKLPAQLSLSANQAGSTLVELLMATMVAAIVLVGAAIGITYSIQRTAEARYRDIATTLAQEGVEVVRVERAQLGWPSFKSKYQNGGVFCVDTANNQTAAEPCDTTVTASGKSFTRVLTMTYSVADQLAEATVTVSWDGGSRTTKAQQMGLPNPAQVVFTQKFYQVN